MLTQRTNPHYKTKLVATTAPVQPVATPPLPRGDIIYGAHDIAKFLFDDDGNRARRRVYNLWAHYHDREEAAGLFKLKGALCLSKSKWAAFHGLGQ